MFLTSKQQNDLPSDISVTIGGHRVVPKPSVRNLGVILDSGLTMQGQVASIAKSCYHQIRNIGQIRSSITDDAWKTLVHALVNAREFAAMRPSADNAAAFATCAKLHSPARLPY